MSLRIYDTRQKHKVDFVPMVPGKVGLYACGITVYDICHVGHARTAVAFDVIVRYLRRRGFDVRFIRNITDVDDKIIRKGQAEGKSANDIARTYSDAMAAMCSVARGSRLGGRQPRAAASSWKIAVISSVNCRMSMPRSAALALILSSTSVMLRTKVTCSAP